MTVLFVGLVLGFTVSAWRFIMSMFDWWAYRDTESYCDDELWLGDTSIHWGALGLAAVFGFLAYFASFWAYPDLCC